VQHREGAEVDDQADAGDDQHQAGPDLGWLADPAHRLHQDVSGDDEQQQPVGDGGEDLDPLPAEGAPAARRPLCEGDRPQRQGDPGSIGSHVARVGQQCQRSRHQTADDLGGHDDEGQGEDDQQATPVPACRGHRRVRVPVSHRLPPRVRLLRAVCPNADAPGRNGPAGGAEGCGVELRSRRRAPAATGADRPSRR
jgi:hypothetical protein